MNVINNIVNRLTYLSDSVPEKIHENSEIKMSEKPNPDKWSKKEILGHLIDSAANNHRRFVLASAADNISLEGYIQNEWVSTQNYEKENINILAGLWSYYIKHLAHIIKNIPPDSLANKITVDSKEYTLLSLIEDFLRHTEYHLKKITGEL